jgi:hypothetical protein
MKISTVQAARALGWTSIALGVTEIAATRWVEETIGVEDHELLVRSFGAREIAAGVTILNNVGLNKTMTAGLWSRVFGDVLDLAALGVAYAGTKNPRGWLGVTAFVVGALGLDVLVASRACVDLAHSNRASEAARKRVRPTQALPNGKPEKLVQGNEQYKPQDMRDISRSYKPELATQGA